MRISDWSSDVCSSDLGTLPIDSARVVDDESALHWDWRCDVLVVGFGAAGASAAIAAHESGAKTLIVERFDGGGATARSGGIVYGGGGTEQQRRADVHDSRSEEHTSELQSLMRNSYAVFCLKKKKTKSTKT